jgi:hypothetical protein
MRSNVSKDFLWFSLYDECVPEAMIDLLHMNVWKYNKHLMCSVLTKNHKIFMESVLDIDVFIFFSNYISRHFSLYWMFRKMHTGRHTCLHVKLNISDLNENWSNFLCCSLTSDYVRFLVMAPELLQHNQLLPLGFSIFMRAWKNYVIDKWRSMLEHFKLLKNNWLLLLGTWYEGMWISIACSIRDWFDIC